MFLLRFGMRSRTSDASARADMYAAALEMSAWAETRGCIAAAVSQHHVTDDGYLPSPVPFAAALAARTTTLPISVAALLLAFYEPVKLAEDLAIVDLLSRGRVSYVVGIGYRDEEFNLFGVDRRTRAALVEQRIGLLRRLWTGDRVEIDGRRVSVTPLPFTAGGPMLAYGGGSVAAARRAGRLGMFFIAETHDPTLETTYREAAAEAGVPAVGCAFPPPGVPLTVFVADDPDRAWDELGRYMLVDAIGYGRWNADRPGTASVSFAQTVEELRNERGAYQVLTPDEAAAFLERGIPLGLQPLVGGIPPDIAWPYLEQAAAVSGRMLDPSA
jgi:alkanesulfonate monooxygenase SsuD/methylene tetrahydromethanopterin reductase-like flavin-dependent oxidoreductase (luciferase family)